MIVSDVGIPTHSRHIVMDYTNVTILFFDVSDYA